MKRDHPCPNSVLDRAIAITGGASALARQMGVGPSAVSNWRIDGIPARRARKLSDVTGIPLEEILPPSAPGRSQRSQGVAT
ncbi:carph-isopro domain-containing protein [Teichococcus aestuarii]|uniref:carph-isopro domain-containing protein n=1 Tax=Teichococcus aestuarii TaxID=568898 RepID=UPI00360620DD